MTTWYSAAFHLAWVPKARPEDEEARERFLAAHENWRRLFEEHLGAVTPKGETPPDPELFLAPRVREELEGGRCQRAAPTPLGHRLRYNSAKRRE